MTRPADPATKQGTRALVLGSSGRVGRMLRHSWAQDASGIAFTFQTRDPASADLLWDVLHPLPQALLHAAPFDCMIVLSGVVPRPGADVAGNAALGAAALAAAARLDIGSVLLASSSAVYGAGRGSPFCESDPAEPVNAYGRAKLEMEEQCRAQARASGIRLCCLRIGNVAGADALLGAAQALPQGTERALDMFADGGTPERSYIGPHSMARVLSTLAHTRLQLPEVLNIAAPYPVTMRALAETAQLPFALVPAPQTAHQRITLDCTALAALHRFAPAESDPAEMVRQWQAIPPPPE